MVREHSFRAQCSVVDIGGLVIAAGRTAPLQSRQEVNQDFILQMLSYGEACYHLGSSRYPFQKGMALLTPNNGGRYEDNYTAGIFFSVSAQKLQQTTTDLLNDLPGDLGHKVLPVVGPNAATLWGLFQLIDQLLLQDRWLPATLGLAEQIYRHIAITRLRDAGLDDRLALRWASRRRWTTGLDALVDYIRANRHQPLTMTDLERISHYSARHLTTLFHERFQCTPMQFVRRQRLGLAMERLSKPQPGDTVIRIARECGYRHASNFSVDFQREFASKPSDVLRLSRRAKAL